MAMNDRHLIPTYNYKKFISAFSTVIFFYFNKFQFEMSLSNSYP